MPLEVELEPGEELLTNLGYQASEDSRPFAIAISDRALYLLGRKRIALSDPYFFQRVPKEQVELVRIRRLRPHGMWAVALLSFVTGLVLSVLMVLALVHGEETKVSGYPLALVVVGLVIPFAIRGRYGLLVEMAKPYRWKPPIVLGRRDRESIQSVFDEIVEGLQAAGIPCRDQRRSGGGPSVDFREPGPG